MTKTFVLEREFRPGTRVFTNRVFFTVTPGSRNVRVENLGPAYTVDITEARNYWRSLLAQRPGRIAGGFADAWKWVK